MSGPAGGAVAHGRSRPQPIAVELPGAVAYFSDRRGGVSEGPFATLNLGLNTADDPVRVRENRRLLLAAIGAGSHTLRWLKQEHGAEVWRWQRGAAASARADAPRADGQLTDSSQDALLVTTADCLPVALAGGGLVAAVHCGWRGLAAGVLAAAVAHFAQPPSAAIGPAIGPCCYQVGPEVAARFRDYEGALRGDRLDLRAVCEQQLRSLGVRRIAQVAACTACDPQRWFSHRRDGPATGRQGVVVIKRAEGA